MIANRSALGPWEVFEMIEVSTTSVAIKSSSGLYVCAENGGVTVNKPRFGVTETFTRVPLSADPSRVAFQANDGTYLQIDITAGGLLRANGTNATNPAALFSLL